MKILTSFFNSAGNKLERINEPLFFFLILIYHVLVTLQGLDFNDEGFHLTIYQQILNDPESVQYGFWMWLTGIIGGLYMKFLPFSGALGIRIAGALVNTMTILIAYRLLKRYLQIGNLRIAIVLLVLFINEDAKNLYYNNLSAFFYFLAAYFLFKGLKNEKYIFLFFSGVIVGLNVFNRVPNVLGTGLVVSIFYYGFIYSKSFTYQLKRAGIFLTGIIGAVLTVLLVMKATGHFTYYVESLKMIFSISSSTSNTKGVEGSYSVFTLLLRNIEEYGRSIRWALSIAVLILFMGVANSFRNSTVKWLGIVVQLFNYLVVIVAFCAILFGLFNSERLLFIFTGVSLISLLLLLNSSQAKELRLLVFIGALVLFIHPYGSSEGIRTVIIYSLWLCFPITIDFLSRIKSFKADLGIVFDKKPADLFFTLSAQLLQNIKFFTAALLMIACFYNVINFPYLCDRHRRLDMRYSVDNKFMRGIFTTHGRAAVLTELLEASKPYIKPNDIVLAFDCMPMYHFMSETRPYTRNPCIWFYSNELFEKELNFAENKKSNLPVVVRQNIKTTGDGSAWPEVEPAEPYADLERNKEKNRIFNDFLMRHHYKQVWTNQAFSIFLPNK